MTKRSVRKARGGALVELVLAVPFFIVVPMVVIEMSQWLRAVQIANVVAQELAGDAYRKCADAPIMELQRDPSGVNDAYRPNLTRLQTRTNNCLQNDLINNFQQVDAAVRGRMFYRVAVFRYFEPTTTLAEGTGLYKLAEANVGWGSSPVVDCRGATGPTFRCVPVMSSPPGYIFDGPNEIVGLNGVTGRQRLVVAEVRYVHEGLSLFGLMRLFNNGGGPITYTYRESAIL